MLLEYHPNHHERDATNTRKGDSEFEVNAVGCRLHGKEGKRVYTLPLNPGVHNTTSHVKVDA